jgi:hypothetical protein
MARRHHRSWSAEKALPEMAAFILREIPVLRASPKTAVAVQPIAWKAEIFYRQNDLGKAIN